MEFVLGCLMYLNMCILAGDVQAVGKATRARIKRKEVFRDDMQHSLAASLQRLGSCPSRLPLTAEDSS